MHSTLDERIQLQRVFRILTVDGPRELLLAKIAKLKAKQSQMEEKNVRSAECKRLAQKIAAEVAEVKKLDVLLANETTTTSGCTMRTINATMLMEVFNTRLHHNQSRAQVDDVIWEVNDKLDGCITWDEYNRYYQRCKEDATGLEPMDFFYLVCFLMYDKDCTGELSIDEAMHMLYMKYGTLRMQAEVEAIFGDKLGHQEPSKELSYTEYYNAINTRREQIVDNMLASNKSLSIALK